MDVKQVLTLIESAEQPRQALTEGKNMAKDMVMQHYTKQEMKTPVRNPINKLNEYFKVVDNEMLNVVKEAHDAKQVKVKKIVNRVLERLDEGKKDQAPKPRNFVAKNAMATTSGAGVHKDKKRAEKQGDVKHKKDRVPMDVAESDDLGSMSHREFKRREMEHELGHEDTPEFKRMMRDADRGPWYIKIDGKIFKQKGEPKMFDWKKGANNYALAILKNKPELQGKITLTKRLPDENEGVAEDSDWGEPREILEDVLQTLEREVEWPLTEIMDPREVRQLLSPVVRAVNDKLLSMDRIDEVAGAEKCWPGHKKVGTQPGTGKNAGKRVNKCVKVGEETDVDESGLQYYTGKKKYGKEGTAALAKAGRKGASEEELGRIKDKYKTVKEDISVGSVVKVYSNVLKKAVFGNVVELKENKAYINYANTKIVMAHPVDKVELLEATAVAPAAGIGSKLARFIPGVGLVAGGYDAYQRAKQGDYTGAALSAGAGLAGLVPGVGTAAATGLIGAQLGRDKARTGSFLPSYDEIGKATQSGQVPTPVPNSKPGTVPPRKTGALTTPLLQMQAELQKAGAKNKNGTPLKVDGLMGSNTQAAMQQFPDIAKKFNYGKPAGTASGA